jgi:Protein of unknown function (DUF3987)/RepB DNA-primase from phage plasmid
MTNTLEFLTSIFDGGCNHEGMDLVEFRLLGNGRTEQIFLSIPDLIGKWTDIEVKLQSLNKKGFNVYYGVRLRTAEIGDATHLCPAVRVLYADLDYKDKALLEKNFAPYKAFNLLPSIVVDTGNGYHCYWLLKEGATHAAAETIMRQIARTLAGDHTYDGPRILRLPGTLNIKDPNNPKLCHISRWRTDHLYTTLDFDQVQTWADAEWPAGKKPAVAKVAPRPAAPVAETPAVYGNGHGFMTIMARNIAPHWKEGVRHKLALGLSAMLRKDGLPESVASSIINKISGLTGDTEQEDRQKAVRTTYGAPDVEKMKGSQEIIESLGDAYKGFFAAYNAAKEQCPPPPIKRSALPEFNLYKCIPPDSLFDKYVMYAAEKTDSPLQYHAASILTLIASALGNKVYVNDFHGKRLYPNLYTLLCGPSTYFRKSNSILLTKPMAKIAKIETYPSNATVELLYSRLAPNPTDWQDKNGNSCQRGEKGAKAVAFYGSPSGIFYHSEFSHYLSASAKSYMQDSRNFFMDLYDGAPGGDVRETKTQGKYTIEDAAISMLCGVTLSSIKTFIDKESTNNGFMPRFLVIMPPSIETHVSKYGRNKGKENIDTYNDLIEQIKLMTTMQGPVSVTPEADSIYEKFEEKLHSQMRQYIDTEKEPIIGFLGRLSAMAFKVATIYGTVMHKTPTVDADAMQYAKNLCDYSAKGLEFFFDETKPGERNPDMQYEEKIIRAARRAWNVGERPVSQLTIYRACHLTSDQIEKGIQSAIVKGVLVPAPGVGRGKRYFLNETQDDSTL